MNPLRLAWFSPLPPDSSEIAEHTRRVQGELEKRFAIEFWKDTGHGLLNESTGAAHELSDLGGSGEFWKEIHAIDIPVYNIGNNGIFHGNIWRLSQHKPGIVVLHDTKLHHLFGWLFRETANRREFYLEKMTQYYGEAGRSAGEAFWRGEISTEFMADYFPLTPLAIENALGLIAHTQRVFEQLHGDSALPVRLAPLPFASTEDRGSRASADISLDHRRARLIIFGHLGNNRRIKQMIAAWGAMPERERFELHLFGNLPHAEEVKTLIARMGMQRLVVIHGFVPAAELDASLSTADLAVNLRFPSMGEASASQLRIWDHALPTLVTRTESYADLPDSAVFFVDPEREEQDIQRHLRDLLARPEFFRQKGASGKEVLRQQHSPAFYAEQVASLCQRAAGLRARHTQTALARRVGEAISHWTLSGAGVGREHYYAERIKEVAAKFLH